MKFNDFLDSLKTYEAGKPIEEVVRDFGINPKDIIKLASNENPLGSSKKVSKVIKEYANKAHLYPDDSMFELKEALSKKYKVSTSNLIIGAGSDQLIEFAIRAKTNPNQGILISNITFAMYEIYALHTGAKIYKTKSNEHNLDEFLDIYEKNKDSISIIFLCVPNNPLGECLKKDEVYKFLEKIDKDTLVVIDGAYNDFAAFRDKKRALNPKDLISKFDNVLFLKTFSKLYGLGGLRIGYGVGKKEIISQLLKIRAPFNVTNISLAAALKALKDSEFVKNTLENNLKEIKKYEKFGNKFGIKFIKSYTNFITFLLDNQDSTEISNALLKQGIIIRDLKSYGINAIRVTVGLPKQNKRVLKEIKKLIK